jgi:hypothetical protein
LNVTNTSTLARTAAASTCRSFLLVGHAVNQVLIAFDFSIWECGTHAVKSVLDLRVGHRRLASQNTSQLFQHARRPHRPERPGVGLGQQGVTEVPRKKHTRVQERGKRHGLT